MAHKMEIFDRYVSSPSDNFPRYSSHWCVATYWTPNFGQEVGIVQLYKHVAKTAQADEFGHIASC